MGFLIENASMSQLSYVWKYIPQRLSPALHRDLFCFPHGTTLYSACILGEQMMHPPCSAEGGFPSFGHRAWAGAGARGRSVGQGCMGGRQLPARTGLPAGFWCFVVLAVGLETPPRYQPNTVPSPALIQAYSLAVKTRKK